jgi:hypothetical protein
VVKMSKRDNVFQTIMMYPKINFQCDGEKLQCRYIRVEGKEWGEWWINGENKKLQCTGLMQELKGKYKNITVLWKSR